MSWNEDGRLVNAVVDDLRRKGAPATAERVANALREHTQGDDMTTNLEQVKAQVASVQAKVAAMVGQDRRLAEDRQAAFAREVEAECIRERVVGYVDEQSGRLAVFAPPTPAPGKRAKPDSEGRVPDQLSSAEELRQLKARAARLQTVVDNPGASQDEKATAQSELDPLLIRIQNLQDAISPPSAVRQMYVEPAPYFARHAAVEDELQSLKDELTALVATIGESTDASTIAPAQARAAEVQQQILTLGRHVPLTKGELTT